MKVRAKMVCTLVQDQTGSGGKLVRFRAVIDGSEENKSFSKYTPAANSEMWISDETPASNFFEEGQEYYVDYSKA